MGGLALQACGGVVGSKRAWLFLCGGVVVARCLRFSPSSLLSGCFPSSPADVLSSASINIGLRRHNEIKMRAEINGLLVGGATRLQVPERTCCLYG